MTNAEKHQLLNYSFALKDQGVKVSIDFSCHNVININIWADTEECNIEYTTMLITGTNVDRAIQEIQGFVMARDVKFNKYEVA